MAKMAGKEFPLGRWNPSITFITDIDIMSVNWVESHPLHPSVLAGIHTISCIEVEPQELVIRDLLKSELPNPVESEGTTLTWTRNVPGLAGM